LICKCEWATQPDGIINAGTGCPRCSKVERLTNDLADQKIKGRKIKRVGDINGCHTKTEFECLIQDCKNIWLANPSDIFSGSGCPKCYLKSKFGIKLTNELIDEKLKYRDIKRIDDSLGARKNIKFQCLVDGCNNIWYATPDNVIRITGCPVCKGRKNEKIIYNFLKKENIIFNRQFPIKFPTNKRSKRVDFFVQELNLIIEYNGAQHYTPICFGNYDFEQAENNFILQQTRDIAIREHCIKNNINLLEIDGRVYSGNKLVNFLKQYFKESIDNNEKI
jgi:very-short-patch-repair endonuclease